MHETPLRESIDIDTPEDWEMGVIITQHLLKTGLIKAKN